MARADVAQHQLGHRRGVRPLRHAGRGRVDPERTCAVIEKYYERYGSIFEFYDSADEVDPPLLPRKGPNNPDEWIHQVVFDYGWTAALYVDMCRREA